MARIRSALDGYPGGRRIGFIVVAAVFAAIAYATATAPFGADYARPACGCDDPGPAIRLLAHGHLHRAAEVQPLMGPVSIVARAPFAAVAYAAGGDDYAAYKLGLIPCLLVLGALGAFAVRRLPDEPVYMFAAPLLAAGFVINPATARAVHFGHPEELLAAALAILGVVAAQARRPLLAGLLVAAAFGTKQWALLAVFVALAVRPEQIRPVIAGVVVGSAAAFLPAIAGDASQFLDLWTHGGAQLDTSAQGGSASVKSTNVWWPLTDYRGTNASGVGMYALPGWIDRICRPLIIAAGIGLSALYAFASRDRDRGLLLLALVLLIRCLLDPFNNSYYNAGFLLALATYEVYTARRMPWLGFAGAGALALTVQLAHSLSADGLNRVYLVWTLPLLGFLIYRVGAPARARPAAATGLGGSPANSGGAILR